MTEQLLPEESVFLHALDMESAADREAYLDQACGDNGKLRDEFPNGEIFDPLLEAKVLIARWRREYNTI